MEILLLIENTFRQNSQQKDTHQKETPQGEKRAGSWERQPFCLPYLDEKRGSFTKMAGDMIREIWQFCGFTGFCDCYNMVEKVSGWRIILNRQMALPHGQEF